MTYDVFKAEAPSTKYPFAQMQPGDAFDRPRGKDTLKQAQNNVGTSARAYAKRHGIGMKFSVLQHDAETVRCYRIK